MSVERCSSLFSPLSFFFYISWHYSDHHLTAHTTLRYISLFLFCFVVHSVSSSLLHCKFLLLSIKYYFRVWVSCRIFIPLDLQGEFRHYFVGTVNMHAIFFVQTPFCSCIFGRKKESKNGSVEKTVNLVIVCGIYFGILGWVLPDIWTFVNIMHTMHTWLGRY